jgi:hypothetical protein
VKHAFDPENVLNPGVKVPSPGQQSIGAIKYDPALAPLAPSAARVLERVERDRAYAEFRLAMLEQGGTERIALCRALSAVIPDSPFPIPDF